jgi:hypothetical protein
VEESKLRGTVDAQHRTGNPGLRVAAQCAGELALLALVGVCLDEGVTRGHLECVEEGWDNGRLGHGFGRTRIRTRA